MTKMITYTPADIPLGQLALHPGNVRAHNETAYTETSVAALAANICAVGLLQPLLVQKLGRGEGTAGYGVLAGGRRLAALKLLAADKAAKGFTNRTKIACHVVPEDAPATAALSLSENEMVLPMGALDRYEAFAALRDADGLDIAAIARMFGLGERSVRETLRIGQVAGDIRAAHRAGQLSLETLRAFAAHPDPAVQMDVFAALSGEGVRVEPWQVKRALGARGVRQGDALGAFVLEAYRKADGVIAPDLIEEDSVLSDPGLVQKILAQQLDDLAEEERARLGFAWAEHRIEPGWDAFEAYDRVYPQVVDLDEAAQAQVDALTAKLDELAEAYETAEDWDEKDRLEAERETLQAQIDGLTTAWSEADAALAGVIALWQHGGVRMMPGMVRPEDRPAEEGPKTPSATGDSAGADAGPKISGKLADEMAHVRTRAMGLALAQYPALARDYAAFLLIRGVCGGGGYTANSTTIRASVASYGPTEADGSLAQIESGFAAVAAGLETDWLDLPGAESFAAFRGLSAPARDALLAYAVAQTLAPRTVPGLQDALRETVERAALPNIRDAWVPDAAFLKRLTKPDLLDILRDVGLVSEAKVYQSGKKSNLVEYMVKLFAAPFATLTDSQLQAVTSWAPDLMAHAPLEDEAKGAVAAGRDDDSDRGAADSAPPDDLAEMVKAANSVPLADGSARIEVIRVA
ncbi:ParB N-terminal domain-containing protein [Ruegeria sp.]|uniref:ParB/RepB/Spo0J family partition protein n=1 Tax=Ruegeria sp. TaxID=1879320 RepID=UPI003B00A291